MKKTLTLFLLAFSSHISFSQPGTQSFVASGSYVVPAGITSLTIEVVGAGGTGGSNGGGGGGGGGYAIGVYNVTPGASIPITVGAGGAGQVAGTTSAGMFLSASGGANGTSVANPNLGGGGAGGVGTGGTIANRTGGTGGGGYWTYFGGGGGGAAGSVANGANGGNTIVYVPGGCLTPGGSGGAGGGAPGGAGGKGAGFTDNSCNNTNPSAPGSTYGGGGGGANGNGGGAGVGAGGFCLITWTNNCTPPASPANTTAAANLTLCANSTTTLSATGTGTINWYTTSGGSTPVATGSTFVTPALNSTTTYYAEDFTCTGSTVRTAITVTVYPLPLVMVITSNQNLCTGGQATLSANGGVSYTWSPYTPATMSSSTGLSVVIQPTVSTVYSVIGVDNNGCKNTASIPVLVNATPTMVIPTATNMVCAGKQATLGAPGVPGSFTWTASDTSSIIFNAGSYIIIQPSVATTYTMIYSGGGPCPSYGTATVGVNALPNISLTSSKVTICRGESSVFTPGGGLSYTLTAPSSSSVSTGTVVVSPTVSTTYTLTGAGANGCVNTFTLMQFVSTCVGVHESVAKQPGFHIFPNPNAGEFVVEASVALQLDFRNELGQVIRTVKLNESNHYKVQVKDLPPGVYFLSDTAGAVRQKIIVAK